MRRAILIALAVFCVVEVTAKANPAGPYPPFTDGNELFGECEGFRTQGARTPDEIVRFRYCEAYILGVADSLAMFKAHLSVLTDVKYCPPKEAESHQLTSVATKYLGDRPEKRHLTAASLVTNALAKAFPCK
jgi:hypothetical protein